MSREREMHEEPLDLWQRVTAHDALLAAWHRVKSNDGSVGGDLMTLGAFEHDLFAHLTQLRAELLQESAFEARLTHRQTDRLIKRAEEILDKMDSLRVYTINRSGTRHCRVCGSGVPIESEAGFWLL